MNRLFKIKVLRNQFGRLPAKVLPLLFSIALFVAMSDPLKAQSGLCEPTVPFFSVNLSSSPSATWTSPLIVRNDFCCGASNPDRCLEFEIVVNPGTYAINFTIASGAVPSGSMFYQINCGPQTPVGSPVCLNGPGPFTLTFCKPGNNANTYQVTSIPSPSVCPNTYASNTCPASIWVQGLSPASVTWSDITGGGVYNSYLSCINCVSPTVTPAAGHPPYVDYRVCGNVELPSCAGMSSFCDTVRVYMFDPLVGGVNPNPARICASSHGVQLNGFHSGGYGNIVYTWYNSAWNPVSNSASYFATTAGTYYLVVSDDISTGCPPDTVIVNVSNSIGNASISVSPSYAGVCQGSPVTLTASGGQNYVWSPTTGLSPTTGAIVNAVPNSTTVYTVSGTDNYGCTGTATARVEIFPLPVVNAGPDKEICAGQTTQLNGSGATFYSWTPTGTLNNPSIANPIASPTVTTTYYLHGSSIGGNIIYNGDFELGNTGFITDYVYSSDLYPEGNYYITNNPRTHHANFSACADHTPAPGTQMMVVNGAPIANQKVWCQNIAVMPNTDYAFGTWITSVHPTNPAVLQFSINSILLGSPFTATTTTCNWQQFYEVWNSGTNTTAQICIVNQNLIRNGNDFALDDIFFAPICTNVDSVVVTVHPNPNISITATSPQICQNENVTLTASSDVQGTVFVWSNGATSSSITVSPGSTTNYSVTGTANGCTGTASIQITVNPLPIVNVTATSRDICVGESSTITATSNISGSTFLWSNGSTTSSITVSPGTTTNYNVTVTSPEGCVTTGSVTINVYPNPVLTISSSATEICNGGSATISVSSSISGTTYQWSNGSTSSSITVGPTSTTTYTVTGTSANGCTGTAGIQITVNPLPVVNLVVSDSVICEGESVTITASSDIAGSTYLWSNGATTPQIFLTPSVTNTYYLTVTSPDGCISTANATITVNPNPILSIVPSSSSICVGSSASLVANSNIAVNSYMWNTAETNPTIVVSPASTSSYSVTATTLAGCVGTSDILIYVNSLPDVSITASNASVCLGSSVDLAASSNQTSLTYQWSTGQNTSSINVVPSQTSTYSVTVTDVNGCTNTADFMVNVNPLPQVNIYATQDEVCLGMSIELLATSNIANTTFQWSTGQSCNPIIVSPVTNTIYLVTGTDPNGCTGSTRISIHVNPNPAVGISPNSYTICPGDTASLLATSTTAVSYIWNTGETTNNILVWPTSSTVYTVTGIDSKGCEGTASANIIVRNAPVIQVSPNNPNICQGESVTIKASGAVLYDWTPGTFLNTNVGSVVTSTPDSTITYTVAGVDLYGCLGSANVTISVHPIPDVDFRADETDICQATVVHFTGSASPNIQSWNWDFGDPASGSSNFSSMQNPMHAFFETGTYTIGLNVTTTAGCKNAIQKPSYIVVHPNPIASFARTPDITTLEYPTIQFYDQSLGEKSRLWNFDDPGSGLDNISIAKDPVHTYRAEGEYWVTLFVENEWGCVDSVSNRIIINPAWDEYIPTAFSPNGDGNNDIFRPMGFNIDFTKYKMYIYDRWGKEIFMTDNIEVGWDGRVKGHGEIVQQDVYVYLIILTDINGLEHHFIGHVTVVK